MANVEGQGTTQLEFHQAMADFKTMFPAMDQDVIEAVLRSNQGAVDATIDQLLAMSTDNENEKIRNELDLEPRPPPPNSLPSSRIPPHAGESLSSKRGWTCVMLAPLPDDFLRLPPESSTHPGLHHRQSEVELEDERIAMLLQNDEFMAELRWNKDFLSVLDKDSPPEERLASFSGKMSSTDDDALFKERLRNMGKMSRKKFSQLARVFTGRKKRGQSAKSILGQTNKDSLLLREDSDSY